MKTLSMILCLLLIAPLAFGEVVCRDKRTDKYVNDFQSLVKKDGTLIGNAIRAGLGEAEDFEEVEVSREEYQQIEKQINDPIRALSAIQAEEERIAKENFKKDAIQKLKALGLTQAEAESLFK